MDYLYPYPKMGVSFLEILEDPLTRKLLGHDAVHAEKAPYLSGVSSRLGFLLSDPIKHLSFLKIGYTALEAFLQANVTGPPLEFDSVPVIFPTAYRDDEEELPKLKAHMLSSLTVDGQAAYALTPRIELFWLAKVVMSNTTLAEAGFNGRRARFRVNFWHQKLLSERSDTLRAQLYEDAEVLEGQLGARYQSKSAAAEEHFVEFLTERAAIRIFYGDDAKAREDLNRAAKIRSFQFALTGALGKRTKYQHRDISQLLVLAKSRDVEPETYSSRKSSRVGASSRKSSLAELGTPKSAGARSKSPVGLSLRRTSQVSVASNAMSESEQPPSPYFNRSQGVSSPVAVATQPENIPLNDDTVLESIAFRRRSVTAADLDLTKILDEESLSSSLQSLDPSNQPQLFPMDSIILLSTASSISNLRPTDGLTREETLPYATRVLDGGSSNWSVYTQALLVRSRIEGYKSRTVERGLLQLQALVDQVIAETSGDAPTTTKSDQADDDASTPSTFLPRIKASDSASVAERLKYVYQISPPLRWELEAELAQRWTQMGGLRTALEIYERLQMHAEVALCLAATDREAEAEQLLKSMLFNNHAEGDHSEISALSLRQPRPADAPRLMCILGDIKQEPSYYALAWTISERRYARAQRSLGQYYSAKKDYPRAAEAYSATLKITRLDNSTWFALGCVQLQLEDWPAAVETFSRVVQLEDSDAEGWSNLALALLRLPPPTADLSAIADVSEPIPEERSAEAAATSSSSERNDDGKNESQQQQQVAKEETEEQEAREEYEEYDSNEDGSTPTKPDPLQHTYEALRALRRAANLKREDARIWDNYLTVAASIPPSRGDTPWSEIIHAMSRVIELRSKKQGEGAVDLNVLKVLINYITEAYEYPDDDDIDVDNDDNNGQQEEKEENEEKQASNKRKKLPFIPRALLRLIDNQITPLASTPTLFTLLSQIALWRHRPHESLGYTEKSWRTTLSQPEVFVLATQFTTLVHHTQSLVDAYRNLGDLPRERRGFVTSSGPDTPATEVTEAKVEKTWPFKARSAVRSVLGRAREHGLDVNPDTTDSYGRLEGLMEGLKK